MKKTPSDSGWQMSPEALKKRDETVKGWSKQENHVAFEQITTRRVQPGQTGNSLVDKWGAVPGSNKVTIHKKRYLADSRGEKMKDEAKQIVSLEEYVKDLKEFKIIKDVYVLSDEREEDHRVSILIKLIGLSNIQPEVFDAENNNITNYLNSTTVELANAVEVSFQYTEVFV